jgi:hypothetical protein
LKELNAFQLMAAQPLQLSRYHRLVFLPYLEVLLGFTFTGLSPVALRVPRFVYALTFLEVVHAQSMVSRQLALLRPLHKVMWAQTQIIT